MFFVYINRTENNALYIGQTDNLDYREITHKNNKGAKFLKNKYFEIVYVEKFKTRTEAMKREKQLKRWTRAKKEALISGNLKLLKML